ncbi:MAG: hypothetical protein ABIP53_07860, partial [Candidatus Limnocylindrales bacterium]
LANVVGEVAVAASGVAAGAITPGEAVDQVVANTGGGTAPASGGGSTGATGGGATGGGVKDPGSPDDQPITPEQRQFVEQMKQELGLRRIHGDVDPVEGDGTTGGVAIGNPADAKIENKNSLVGNPGQGGGGSGPGERRDLKDNPRPGLGQGPDHGGDIDNEDGTGFTGGVRTQGPGDIDFGVGQKPLLGRVGSQSDDDEEESDDDDDSDDDA